MHERWIVFGSMSLPACKRPLSCGILSIRVHEVSYKLLCSEHVDAGSRSLASHSLTPPSNRSTWAVASRPGPGSIRASKRRTRARSHSTSVSKAHGTSSFSILLTLEVLFHPHAPGVWLRSLEQVGTIPQAAAKR